MRWDDDWDQYDDQELDELLEPAIIAPTLMDMFEAIVLICLEAGTLTEADLDRLDEIEFPGMPENATAHDKALHLALRAYDECLEDPELARELADEAMELDPACIDARVARWFTLDITSQEALVAADVAAVSGSELASATAELRDSSDLWQYPRLRGVVRAFAALALANWAHGLEEDAIEVARRR
ncbi:MAG: hypothetical protein U9R79_22165 [Armatimonadota bacterium]|nr:hypothetical protein [Armatimonadota bacterium]